jgi:hypothetical protein
MLESEVQNIILHWLNMQPSVFAWRNNTTGVYDKNIGGYRKLGGFSIKGVSDILGLIAPNGRQLAIEVKAPGKENTLTREQEAFLNKVQRMGGIAFVASSLGQVQQALESELNVVRY